MKFRLNAMIPPTLYSDSDGNTFYCEFLFQIQKLNNLCFRILRFNTVILQNMFSGLKKSKKKILTLIFYWAAFHSGIVSISSCNFTTFISVQSCINLSPRSHIDDGSQNAA